MKSTAASSDTEKTYEVPDGKSSRAQSVHAAQGALFHIRKEVLLPSESAPVKLCLFLVLRLFFMCCCFPFSSVVNHRDARTNSGSEPCGESVVEPGVRGETLMAPCLIGVNSNFVWRQDGSKTVFGVNKRHEQSGHLEGKGDTANRTIRVSKITLRGKGRLEAKNCCGFRMFHVLVGAHCGLHSGFLGTIVKTQLADVSCKFLLLDTADFNQPSSTHSDLSFFALITCPALMPPCII